MKKSFLIVIFALALVSFGPIGFKPMPADCDAPRPLDLKPTEPKKLEPANFFYDVHTRFKPITLEEVKNASTLYDFFEAQFLDEAASINTVRIVQIENEKPTSLEAKSEGIALSPQQIKLLQTRDYSDHFGVQTHYTLKVPTTHADFNDETMRRYTVTPKLEAQYNEGKEALLAHFSVGNLMNTGNLDPDKLNRALLYFTVTPTGTIESIKLNGGCGYVTIDSHIKSLLLKTNGMWVAAKNAKGQAVAQELVLTYGVGGC